MPEVFWFKTSDSDGFMHTYPKKGTEEAIRRMDGEKVWGSVEEVEVEDVDADGFYSQPRGRFEDLSPRNRDLIARLAPNADAGLDWDQVELTGLELNRALDAAREEGRQEASGR